MMSSSCILFQRIALCCCVLVIRATAFVLPAAPYNVRTALSVSVPTDLASMTVKDLKQLLKDSAPLERGVMSKLKLKKDLIEYIEQTLPAALLLSDEVPIETAEPVVVAVKESVTIVEEPVALAEEPVAIVEELAVVKEPEAEAVDQPKAEAPPLSTQPSKKIRPGAMPQFVDTTKLNRDDMFEYVKMMYPPLREDDGVSCTELGDDDIRQTHHPMLKVSANSDMDLITVGTASCQPGLTRGVSCTALRLNWQRRYLPTGTQGKKPQGKVEETSFVGGTWLFDAGECTQLQAQRTNRIRPGKVTKIFLSHAHGDHTFGLPGLLCLMGQDRDRDSPPVDIYGPQGLRMWLRVAIRYSVSRIIPPYRVHEIMDIPMAPEWRISKHSNRFYNSLRSNPKEGWTKQGLAGEDPESWISNANRMPLAPSTKFGEIPGGREIYPQYDHPKSFEGAPVWEVEDEDDVRVTAAPMSHGVPCLGFVVEEQSIPGRLRNEIVEPIVTRNIDALKEAGFKIPMKAMAIIKNLPEGAAFTFPDGSVITQEDAVEPPRSGRKVVICGDTADARALTNLAMDADVVVHEATNAYLYFLDRNSDDIRSVTKDSKSHGHSTPQMASAFAQRVNAKRLLLNHFSPRYKGDQETDSISIMTRIERQAMAAGGFNETQVAAAWDFMLLPIPQR